MVGRRTKCVLPSSACASSSTLLQHLLPLLLLPSPTARAVPADVAAGHGRGSDTRFTTREDFPPEFVFGSGTSAYQYEGAAAEDGRTPSIWDTFTHRGGLPDKSTGDVSVDGYHKYKEDVQLMKDTNLDAYRFSISWSRLLPNGGRGEVNPKGLEYYNNLIDELLKHGIQPHVTLYHYDLPQSLEDEYGGWLSPKIVEDFAAYADVCFREFGDRVLHWTPLNEPNIAAIACYNDGMWPPNRCSASFGHSRCAAGDSTTEPYIALHHGLLAHAAAAAVYRTKYQTAQNGSIGANMYTFGFTPATNSTADVEATERAKEFVFGWMLDPLFHGDYPRIMRERVGSKLPDFTKQQSQLLRSSVDYIGLNHYTSMFVKDLRPPPSAPRDFNTYMAAVWSPSRNEMPTGLFVPKSLPSDPDGLEMILNLLRTKYGNPPIYIHENGIWTHKHVVDDAGRIHGLKGFIGALLKAFRNGSNIKGYFVWSFVDVLELFSGYQSPLGLYYVDFHDKNHRRMPKSSAIWYRDFIKRRASNDIQMISFNATLHDTK